MKKVVSLISLSLLTACSVDPTGSGNNTDSGYAFSITNSNKSIVCSLHKDGTMASDDGIKLQNLYPMMENTYSNLPNAALLDSEETDYNYGLADRNTTDMRVYNFFKFTFYVKNVSNELCGLSVKFNIKDVRDKNAKGSLIDSVRLMVFENNSNLESHNYDIYAEKTNRTNIDKDGNTTNREYVAESAQQEDDNHPLVTSNFREDGLESNDRCVEYSMKTFSEDTQLRYTMVVWLEGNDPDSNSDREVPLGTSLRFNVEIS